MKYFFSVAILAAFFVSGTGHARNVEILVDNERKMGDVLPRLISVPGEISCLNRKHKNSKDCDPVFIRRATGAQYEIVESPGILTEFHQDHSKSSVVLSGNVVFRMIFHDDHLKVSKFTLQNPPRGRRPSISKINNEWRRIDEDRPSIEGRPWLE